VHVADPAEAAGARNRKMRAKTDRIDARKLREQLEKGDIHDSWIPPRHVLEIREKVRLYADLSEAKEAWQKRIHATFFHQGVPKPDGRLLRGERVQAGRVDPDLSPAGEHAVHVAMRMIAAIDKDLVPRTTPSFASTRRARASTTFRTAAPE